MTQEIYIVISRLLKRRELERSAWPDLESATDHLNWMKENCSESVHRLIVVEGGGRFTPSEAFTKSRANQKSLASLMAFQTAAKSAGVIQ